MQEITKEKPYIGPALGALEKIEHDIKTFGYCSEQTKKQIIDEEKTHAAEIVASACYETDIPREYYLRNDDIFDGHGVSLKNVLEKGIKHIEQGHFKKNGWEWELKRRKSESKNLEKIISMPEGLACIEISSTDISKPESELKSWGYSGSTLVRVTYKNNNGILTQRNVMFNISDIKTLNMLRKEIDFNSDYINNSDELLSSPLFVSVNNGNLDCFVAEIKNFIKEQESSRKPLNYLLNVVKRSKNANNNSWEVVKDHYIFEEMFNEMTSLVNNNIFSETDINLIRAGAWQVLLDQVSSSKNTMATPSINNGKARALSLGAVFTSCGGTITLESPANSYTSGFFDRYQTAKSLLDRISISGTCKACGVSAMMYGCGVYCRGCNSIWCQEYIDTGRQLSHKEILEKKYKFLFWS